MMDKWKNFFDRSSNAGVVLKLKPKAPANLEPENPTKKDNLVNSEAKFDENYVQNNLIQIINDNTFINKVASLIANNTLFIELMVASLEKAILTTLENRYDFVPSDKYKDYIQQQKSELENINIAIEDKAQKLNIINTKVTEALQDIAPKIQSMLLDIAQNVMNNTVTDLNNNNHSINPKK